MERCTWMFGWRRLVLFGGLGIATVMSMAPARSGELCGGVDYPFPYTDVSGVSAAFCPGIMEAYVTGVSKGTTPTTFSPNETVTRVQMTTFLQRSLDQGVVRNSWRAVAEQWWLTSATAIQSVALGAAPQLCKPDRDSIWVAAGNTVVRVEASTGKVLGTWTGANGAVGVLVAAGEVFVTGNTNPGVIYVIDPTQPPGPVMTLSTLGDPIGAFPRGIAFDGQRIWTANSDGTLSYIVFSSTSSSEVTTVSGFSHPFGMVFDGSYMWTTDLSANALYRLNGSGQVIQTVPTGAAPAFPVFDGANIWVPNSGDSSITVVQASTGAVVATIAPNGSNKLSEPAAAAFDGQRILVTNQNNATVTMFKAADLSLLTYTLLPNTGATPYPYGACADGLNFWVTDNVGANLDRI